MKIDAADFVNNAEAILPWLEKLAVLTSNSLDNSLCAILRRAIANPETKDMLIAWLKWLPVFGANGGEPDLTEPELPACYGDVLDDAIHVRTSIHAANES